MARGRRTEEGDAVPRAEGTVTRSAARGASLTAPVHSTAHGGDGGEDEGGGSNGGRVRRKKKKYFHGWFSTDHV
jgi:hypothetical protein